MKPMDVEELEQFAWYLRRQEQILAAGAENEREWIRGQCERMLNALDCLREQYNDLRDVVTEK